MANPSMLRIKNLAVPFLVFVLGIGITFHYFWAGFDQISGDLGDARFNAMTLEHTWQWISQTGVSLFNRSIFYPHPNTYAYSDYLFSSAPIYWALRMFDIEVLLSFQWWIIINFMLNFCVFYRFSRRSLDLDVIQSTLVSYLFCFSLPRVTHLEHAQLIPQYFVVISSAGALKWWRNPGSKSAPILFFLGAALQAMNAFYFFWFWIWSVTTLVGWGIANRERRLIIRNWMSEIPKRSWLIGPSIAFLLTSPFLYHYFLAAREFGARGWVVISNMVPRPYSWFAVPPDHWEWAFTPFKSLISSLPVVHEHFISFGLMTWAILLVALFHSYRVQKLRVFTIPLIAMFVFTLTSGRFSAWVFMTYLFPAGTAIRAVARIQIFMLLFWAVLLGIYLKSRKFETVRLKLVLAAIFLAIAAESSYFSNWHFSRADENQRVLKLAAQVKPECKILALPAGFFAFADQPNVDAMRVAQITRLPTVNGYSGNQPAEFSKIFFSEMSDDEKVNAWFSFHHLDASHVCYISSQINAVAGSEGIGLRDLAEKR